MPGGAAHNAPVQGLSRMTAATAGSSSSTVETARSRSAKFHGDFDTLTTSSRKVVEQLASSLGSQGCASHGKKRLVSLGQQQRQRQRR